MLSNFATHEFTQEPITLEFLLCCTLREKRVLLVLQRRSANKDSPLFILMQCRWGRGAGELGGGGGGRGVEEDGMSHVLKEFYSLTFYLISLIKLIYWLLKKAANE